MHALAFDDRWLYAASDQRIIRFAPETPKQTRAIVFTDLKIQHLQVADDAIFLAGAYRVEYGFVAKLPRQGLFEHSRADEPQSKLSNDIHSIAQWSVTDFPAPITTLHASDDVLVVGDRHGTLRSLQQVSGELLWKVKAHSKLVSCVASISLPDGTVWLASGDWGGKIVISDAHDGSIVESYDLHRDAITDLVPTAGHPVRLVSSSRDATVRLWYVEQHRLVRFYRHSSPLLSLARWDGDVVLSATRDANLLWIDTSAAERADQVECPIDYIHALASSPRHIAISNGRDKIFVAARPDFESLVDQVE